MLVGGLYERTSGAAGQPLGGYRRRAPERTVLHELVAGHAQTLLAELRDADPDGGGLPRYVERELAAYLRCGILAHGFTRVRCQTCHDEIVVAFSCKRRGICPSCTARRMADTAAHLVDRVLPRAPYRQWVFTVPRPLRLVLARDPAWTSWVGNLVVRAIGAWQRRVARKRGLRTPLTGAVTFAQRFGGLVNLNVHFHLVVPDGVFAEDGAGLRFEMLPVPTNAQVLAILDRIMRRIARRLAKDAARRDLDEDATPDLLAQIQADAASTWQSPMMDASASRPVRGAERLRAWCEGFSLHAGVVIAAHDRDALERLCRYGARPAFALERLAWTDDGRISYKLKRAWPDGRTHLVMEPVAFLRRLVGIIPPPRRHLVRYSGVFGPASKHRAKLRALVPTDIDAPPKAACGGGSGASSTSSTAPSSRVRRLPWADLLRRVFADDVLQCPCGGRRSVVAVVTMGGLWIIVLASTSACIEGVDPNDCGLDADCGSGRVCSAMKRCALPEEVHDIAIHWTIDGIVPTLAMPGRCSEVTAFAVGASMGGTGYIEHTTCANGTALLVRAPRELAVISAYAYGDVGNGGVRVLGQASSPLPTDADEVMLDVVLP